MLWKDHLCTNLLSWKRFFLLPEIHNINLSFILKFISPSFLLNMNFLFLQVHVFRIISFFRRNLFELKNFCALIFHGLKHGISPCWCHQRCPEAGSSTWLLLKPKKVISILTKTHINHDQIHNTRNNWLSPIFFPPGDSHTKGMLFLLIWVLKVSLRLTMIQKVGLYP